jgi:hypothetical protein
MSPGKAYENIPAELEASDNEEVIPKLLEMYPNILAAIAHGLPLTNDEVEAIESILPPRPTYTTRQLSRPGDAAAEGILGLGDNLFCIDGACF